MGGRCCTCTLEQIAVTESWGIPFRRIFWFMMLAGMEAGMDDESLC